jgi:hypothetical protein
MAIRLEKKMISIGIAIVMAGIVICFIDTYLMK